MTALALAQDVEETLDEEARPEAKVVGQAGYAYQGKPRHNRLCWVSQ